MTMSGTPAIDEREVAEVIARVRERLGMATGPAGPAPAAGALPSTEPVPLAPAGANAPGPAQGIHPNVESAVGAAREAFRAYGSVGLDRRHCIVEGIRRAALREADRLARMALEETGMGRSDDKATKIRIVAEKAPGPEDLEPRATTGDRGMMITEWAPFGILAAITPVTNPASTVINNTISGISAGNAVVFNPHPGAKRVSAETVRMISRAIVEGGGPPGLVTAVAEPTIDSARELMNHEAVSVLVVTGGGAVVREALKTTKRAVTAGPGNPPAVVDETADLEKAGRDIVWGASFDNNVVCVDEKEVLVVDRVADRLMESMQRQGARLLSEQELRKVERLIFTAPIDQPRHGMVDVRWVGKDADRILAAIGGRADREIRLLIADVPRDHPLVYTEQLLPVLPIVRVRDVNEAISLAVEVEHGFKHTASIHSTNVDTITRMARAMNCSIFVANGPCYAGLGEGGEGFTSFSIASPSGDGLTRPRTFSRERRVAVVGALRIV
jgi:acyl-CoA reductase-like NAD-dependent aldehyde dehydrogenase